MLCSIFFRAAAEETPVVEEVEAVAAVAEKAAEVVAETTTEEVAVEEAAEATNGDSNGDSNGHAAEANGDANGDSKNGHSNGDAENGHSNGDSETKEATKRKADEAGDILETIEVSAEKIAKLKEATEEPTEEEVAAPVAEEEIAA